MNKIDRETVQRILDTADIVDVVSDYVSLKKRGANYIGLCPFHADRNPSFSVSKSRGYCKCFSCGKGGDVVGFIREIENLTYSEALRHLAKKYNIEIQEREETDEEREADRERQSLFAVNEWAERQFQHYLTETDEGREIGLSYFRERGLSDAIIEKFGLGYCPERNMVFFNDALKAGYSEKYLLETGLCTRSEDGKYTNDRFRGRVIFPVFTPSGRVVAFGGRVMQATKTAKYINSPESAIYEKKRELYGLYQAKNAIRQNKFCILVEGYMDVISMSQAGIENIVASSGTALTVEQVKLLHRYTDRVLFIYDADEPGQKAMEKGVNLLLPEGLDVTIVTLPEGEDPDSFAQSHTTAEIEDYIREHTEDFIRFKAKRLMTGLENNPLERAHAINSVLQSVALIRDKIKREVYCQECARLLDVPETILRRELVTIIHRQIEQSEREAARRRNREDVESFIASETSIEQDTSGKVNRAMRPVAQQRDVSACEREVLRYVVRYGFLDFCDAIDAEGKIVPMNVLDCIENDITTDNISFSNPVNLRLFNIALGERDNWRRDYDHFMARMDREKSEMMSEGIAKIRQEAIDLKDIERLEKELDIEIQKKCSEKIRKFTCRYLEKKLLSSEDGEVSELALQLVAEKHQLSRYHTKFTKIPTEIDKLDELIATALNSWKSFLIDNRIKEVMEQLEAASRDGDQQRAFELMKLKVELDREKSEYALMLGERVFGPPK